MSKKHWENKYRDLLICVDKYDGRILMGRLVHPALGRAVRFWGTVDLLRRVEELLDELRFPQPYSRLRMFRTGERTKDAQPESAGTEAGRAATFQLRIFFRQNASWQGAVRWLEGGQSIPFRSVLELLLFMDGTLFPGADGQLPPQDEGRSPQTR